MVTDHSKSLADTLSEMWWELSEEEIKCKQSRDDEISVPFAAALLGCLF